MEPSDASRRAEVAELYTRVAPAYGRVGPDILGYFGRRLVDRAGIAAGASVLDVGTGRGQVLFPALEAAGPEGHAVGIDLAEGMVAATAAELASEGVTNVEVLCMDAERLAFGDASFDAVLCGFTIFWLPHLSETLAGFFRVLRPEGRLGISLSAGGDERWRWYNDLLVEYHDRYGVPLSPGGGGGAGGLAGLVTALRDVGFVAIDVATESREFNYADAEEWWAAKWTHGARYPLERMPPEILERFKGEAFSSLVRLSQPGGFQERWSVACVIATRPASPEDSERLAEVA